MDTIDEGARIEIECISSDVIKLQRMLKQMQERLSRIEAELDIEET